MSYRKEEGPDFNENLLSDDHKQFLSHSFPQKKQFLHTTVIRNLIPSFLLGLLRPWKRKKKLFQRTVFNTCSIKNDT